MSAPSFWFSAPSLGTDHPENSLASLGPYDSTREFSMIAAASRAVRSMRSATYTPHCGSFVRDVAANGEKP